MNPFLIVFSYGHAKSYGYVLKPLHCAQTQINKS